MKKVFIIFILLFMTACTNNDSSILSPTNIVYSEDMLFWNASEHATKYKCLINNYIFEVEDAFFATNELQEGNYEVMIISMQKSKSSLPSTTYSFTIVRNTQIPSNIHFEENILKWDKVLYAIGYEININGSTQSLDDNEYDCSSLEENEFYEFKIATIYPDDKKSNYSQMIVYSTFFQETDVWKYSYHKGQEDPLKIDLSTLTSEVIAIFDENDVALSVVEFSIMENELVILQPRLETYSYGEYDYQLYTNEGKIIIQIYIGDVRKPHMIGNGSYQYEANMDIVIAFELYDGIITSLSNETIKTSDYEIDGALVTIHHEYLDDIFSDESRSLLVVGYVIESDAHLVIGYLFIRR